MQTMVWLRKTSRKVIFAGNTLCLIRKYRAKNTPETIAYIAGGGIGDVIMAYPAIIFLKNRFPRSSVDVFVPAKPFGVIKELFRDFSVFPGSTSPFMKFPRKERYDLSVSNTTGAFFLALEWNARRASRYSIGFRYRNEKPRYRLYSTSMEIQESMHDIDQNILRASEPRGSQPDIPEHPYPGGWNIETSGNSHIIIHPGCETGYDYKLWPAEKYNELISRIVAAGFHVKVLLGPADAGMLDTFKQSNGTELLVSPEPVKLLTEIRQARLFVGNDSGPAHIAAFFGVPAVTLTGPADPRRTAPRGLRSLNIYNNMACSPCHFLKKTCSDNECMKSITVNQVWEKIELLLNAAG